ncbi:hypothetical protein GCM10010112_93550 [Actinoplanes lobatus]|uniref:Uncharacterized protein n=1 Tax=Actinoplanes lobatus TaxID=113568 RepID=A0A7W7MJA0_9ACTN|nr:hypothetical protein [Actinoplanes lobatus]MBB4751830.1 hypothetical protein [Actinoplanes lobatus]GGN99581.1 hypothetical protein GCM10010112_93550 [Actinoplanes lobatus]GIE46354.1 hypothetical protein Alo02nite_92520 [Actinoplanes lobatus]
MPPRLTATLDSLGCRAVPEVHIVVGEYLGGYGVLDDAWEIASARLGVSDRTDDEVRAWLRSLPVDADSVIRIDWARDGIGAELPFSVFAQHFDDLWYPSSDDVVVLTPDGALLYLDHEERFSFVPRLEERREVA